MRGRSWRTGDGSPFSRWMSVVAATAMATMIGGQSVARGQVQDVKFEVTSVKVDPSPLAPVIVSGGSGFIGFKFLPSGRFVATWVTLRSLIIMAYEDAAGRRVQATDIQGGPAWIDSLHFNIEGTFNPALLQTKEGGVRARSLMVRRLLEERFGLRVHFETREMTRLELVMARQDRRRGPQLLPASGDCVVPTMPPGAGRGGPQELPKPPNCPMMGGTSSFAGASVGMDFLAIVLGTQLRTKVVNRTQLEGLFDIELKWRPEIEVSAERADGESLLSALEHQLGLKLEKKVAPTEVLVVDAAERPTAN